MRLYHSSHWVNSVCSNVDDVSTNDAAESPLGASHLAGGSCNGTTFETESCSDQSCWDRFLNEFAKHIAFLKLKITESYMLPKSVAHGILEDIRTIFDTFQEYFMSMAKSRLASTGSDWQDDSLLQQILGDESIYDVVQNKFSSDHLFEKYLTDNLKLNSPVACRAAITDTDVT